MFSVVLGYVAMTLLMLGGIFQAAKNYKQGHANGVSSYYIFSILLGFITMLWYVLLTNKSIPLIVNYIISIMSFGLMAWLKFFPRKTK
jgi:uncharacterized protein with PQ loop repeat